MECFKLGPKFVLQDYYRREELKKGIACYTYKSTKTGHGEI